MTCPRVFSFRFEISFAAWKCQQLNLTCISKKNDDTDAKFLLYNQTNETDAYEIENDIILLNLLNEYTETMRHKMSNWSDRMPDLLRSMCTNFNYLQYSWIPSLWLNETVERRHTCICMHTCTPSPAYILTL